MPSRPCTFSPNCPNPAAVGSRCSAHAVLYVKVKDEGRGIIEKERRHVYHGPRWIGARRAVLERDPFCSDGCGRVSTVADHVIPLRRILEQGLDPYDIENLEGVCAPCHGRRTRLEQQGLK